MAFGKRLRFFRTRKGLTQKQVGEAAGFKGNTSEVRMAQYETEARTPKEPLIQQLSEMYGVSPRAIKVPDIDSELGLMHTLFALEDMYGFRIANIDGAQRIPAAYRSPCSTCSVSGMSRQKRYIKARLPKRNMIPGATTSPRQTFRGSM